MNLKSFNVHTIPSINNYVFNPKLWLILRTVFSLKAIQEYLEKIKLVNRGGGCSMIAAIIGCFFMILGNMKFFIPISFIQISCFIIMNYCYQCITCKKTIARIVYKNEDYMAIQHCS